MKKPTFSSGCLHEHYLPYSINLLLTDIQLNINEGYLCDLDAVSQVLSEGVTLEAFNMLVLNINREFAVQYQQVNKNTPYSMTMSFSSRTH